jgi:acyl-CoA synthetase (NDP forming)
MYRYKQGQRKKEGEVPSFRREQNNQIVTLLEKYAGADAQALTSIDAGRLLDEFEIDIPNQTVIHSPDEAVHFAQNSGYPVVIKSASDKILHKTDLKALYLNITNEHQLRENFTQLTSNMRHVISDNQPIPVLIQEQVSDGVEVILGANRDGASDVYEQTDGIPGFGHVLLFGTGGIYTEVYSDTSSRLVAANSGELREMLEETNIFQILEGARGQEPKAIQRVIETLEKLQTMVMTYPIIEQIDINPAFVTKTRCVVVDFKVLVKQ